MGFKRTVIATLSVVSAYLFMGQGQVLWNEEDISNDKSNIKASVKADQIVFPNVRLNPSGIVQQTGIDVVRDPSNPNQLFATALTSIGGGSSFINSGIYTSTNGGATWTGSDTVNAPKLNDQRGYPSPVIDKNGRYYITHITSATNFGSVTGVGVNYSTDRGLTWASTVQIVNDVDAGRSIVSTDNSPTSPYYGNVYSAWSTGATTPSTGRFSKTTDGGVTWTTPLILNAGVGGRNAQGHDMTCGPDGQIYSVWAMTNQSSPFTEDFLGFARSTNGGSSFSISENLIDINGISSTSYNGWGIAVNGFPRIAVDHSTGPRRGWIYMVTAQSNLPPAGSDADIVMYRSTDNGVSWSGGIRVNTDPSNSGKVQFFPAVCVDNGGIVHVVYYDNRGFASVGDSCSVYISSSLDGGNSWSDTEIADHHFKPKQASSFGAGYFGDYIGITESQGRVVATWMDDKGGAPGFYNVWSGGLQVLTYPLNAFDLQTPASGITITSLANEPSTVTITWDTSASTASYKWIFGSPTISNRRITIPASTNFLTLTLGQLDNALAAIGVPQGGQVVGQWDVWAFRNNQTNDSLKSANGPRAITFRRGLPSLNPFSLAFPQGAVTIVTSPFSTSTSSFRWTETGAGATYKWKFGSPTISNVLLSLPSFASGFDTLITLSNRDLDATLAGFGLNPGDSLTGQWAVWAYSGPDSLRSAEVRNITLKRQQRGDVIIVYDSTTFSSRVSRDSIVANLNALGISHDQFNRGVNVSDASMSFKQYKRVLLLGEASSVMSNRLKDSLKSYLSWGSANQKAKLMIMAEDIGYHLDRPASVYYDPDFARNWLGFEYSSDFPGAIGGKGLTGALANPNQSDSTVGPRPDVIRKSANIPAYELHDLYKFRGTSILNGVGRIGTTFNVSIMAIDVESLRRATDSPPGSPVRRMLQSSLDFVDGLLTVSVNNISNAVPERFALLQNYPNPFNPSTSIEFALPEYSRVKLKIFDISGKEIGELVNEELASGTYRFDFNAGDLSSGVYFYRIEATGTAGNRQFTEARRMILLK